MNDLPQELINHIVSYAERYPDQDQWIHALQCCVRGERPSRLPPLATLNLLWKEAIEAITFYSISINSDELDSLHKIVTGNRRNYLTRLFFRPLLPQAVGEERPEGVSREDLELQDEALAQSTLGLFDILKTWENEGVRNALHLHLLSANPCSDGRMSDAASEQLRKDIATRKHKKSVYNLWETSQLPSACLNLLPELSNVTQFKMDGDSSRRSRICVAPDLARFMPNLTAIEWGIMDYSIDLEDDFSDDESSVFSVNTPDSAAEAIESLLKDADTRCTKRIAIAEALSKTKLLPHSSAQLSFWHESPSDQRQAYPSIVPPGPTYDPFSAALRNFSQNLAALTLSANVDSTLFWPSPDENNEAMPFWPHLKSLQITLGLLMPSGDWYFIGPQPTGDADVAWRDMSPHSRETFFCHYRVHPDPRTFDPFLAAFARAVPEMPRLEYFMLTSDFESAGGKLHIEYCAPGKSSYCAEQKTEDLQHRRIYYACEVDKVWVPEPETAELIRGAGRATFGGDVIERFMGSCY